MARGKGKYGPKSKILVVLKSAHQKFLENALSKLIFSKVENGTPYCNMNAKSWFLTLNFDIHEALWPKIRSPLLKLLDILIL